MEKYRDKRIITPKNAPYFFIFPALVLFLVFNIYPIITSLKYSFYDIEGAAKTAFLGLGNYSKVFHDKVFWKSIANVFIMASGYAPVLVILPMLVAHFLNTEFVKLKVFFRTSYYLPYLTSMVVYSMLFNLMFSSTGIVNVSLTSLGFDPVLFFQKVWLARLVVVIAKIWHGIGYNVIIYLAAMQSVDRDLYSAASIDGATDFQQFTKITIPQVWPVFIFILVLTTKDSLNIFAESYLMTGGGPAFATITPAHEIFENIMDFKFGYASAQAYIMCIIASVLAIIQFRLTKEK